MALQKTVLPILQSESLYTPDFEQALHERGCGVLTREEVKTLQINVGKFCNQACHHCHVEAGPKRTEVMPQEVAPRGLHVLAPRPSITTVDITGRTPAPKPNFHLTLTQP